MRFFFYFIAHLFLINSFSYGKDANKGSSAIYDSAYNALHAEHNNLVWSEKNCLKGNKAKLDDNDYVLNVLHSKIDKTKIFVFVFNLMSCSGGNSFRSYLVLSQDNTATIIKNIPIGDWQFDVTKAEIENNFIKLSGLRFADNDSHACPSFREQMLIDINTKEYTYKTIGKNKC